jgi:hypothetical protein
VQAFGDCAELLSSAVFERRHCCTWLQNPGVLAELLAKWLAGHVVPGDRIETILMRGRILHERMKIVRDLAKINAMRIELEDIQGACESDGAP